MKIIYSTCFDADIFLGEKPQAMGVTYVGNTGLLAQLELRAGLATCQQTDVEREAAYLNALRGCIEGTLFESAFKADEMGVASRLLEWRDALVMAGWDVEERTDTPEKLKVLTEAEKNFHYIGIADRWRRLAEVLAEDCDISDQIQEVEVVCPWTEVPAIIQRTLENLKGVTVTKYTTPTTTDLDVKKVSVVAFDQLLDAYEWFATATLPEGTVVVNRDNGILNHVLYTWDKPLTTAWTTQSNPALLQLFKLGISVFSRPVNIHNLTSYLQLPAGPIPSPLRRSLAYILLHSGGFGDKDALGKDEWERTIDSYEFLNKEGKPTKQEKAKKLPFLAPIRKEYSGGIPKEDVKNYVEHLKGWVQGHFANKEMIEDVKRQYRELYGQLTAFLTTLEKMAGTLQYNEIEAMAQCVYRPMNYASQRAEALSANIVSDVRAIAAPAETLLWLDCQEADRETDAYDFLNKAEREFLTKLGVVIPDFSEHLCTMRQEQYAAMGKAKNIVLVKSAYHGTTRLGEHPVIAEVAHLNNGKLPLTSKNNVFTSQKVTLTKGNVEVFAPQPYLELDRINWPGREESNHSIDTLINFPFDYVTNYIAQLWETQNDQQQGTQKIQGLVAHHVFEHIVNDSHNNTATMRQLADNEFDARLDHAIDATGLILRLPENASLLASFKEHLKESLTALLDIMDTLDLTAVGCEMAFPQQNGSLALTGIGPFGARIDFLLTNKKGDYVIFDFKWTYSNRYEEKLKNNMAIQLELYRQTVEETYKPRKVAGVGYFLMPRKLLVTTDFQSQKGINHIDAVPSTLADQIRNSFKFRMDEIQRGHIEEGEMLDMMPYPDGYIEQTAMKDLCPIGLEEKFMGRGKDREIAAKIKGSSYVFKPSKKMKYDNNNAEPAEKATTHQILKGRLK